MSSIFGKRHYQIVAKVLRTKAKEEEENYGNSYVIEELSFDFCNIFAEDNPNFDKGKFLKACGAEE